MKGLWRVGIMAGVIFATIFTISGSVAQDVGGGGGGRRGMRDRQGPRFDPAQMMSRVMDNYKERLGFNDTEWEAVKPVVQTVFEKQMATRMGGMGGMRGPRRGQRGENAAQGSTAESANKDSDTPPAPPEGGPPPGGPMGMGGPGGPMGPPPGFGPQMPEMEALQTALDEASTTEADIQTKLKELRAARQKQEDELKASREKLRALLTVRQEATCVMMGLLD